MMACGFLPGREEASSILWMGREEAKRARADGFIVKPFEASELLSALTKLEDKIVPRSEGSKPGRFARSIAAIEEGRYDKGAAPEEDSSR